MEQDLRIKAIKDLDKHCSKCCLKKKKKIKVSSVAIPGNVL